MEEYLVSIIIPTFNRKNDLVGAIESVLVQTYKNVEIIIIDDGSRDDTFSFISEKYKNNSNIIILKNDKNLGFVKTLSKGINLTKGKYLARIDDDDLWTNKNKLTKQVDFLEHNKEYVLIGTGAIMLSNKGKSLVYIPPEEDSQIRNKILVTNIFIHSSVLFLKETYNKTGGYKDEFGFYADWELWLNFGKFGKFKNLPETDVFYLDRGSTKSHDIKIRRELKKMIKMKSNYKNFYPNYKKSILFVFLSYFYSFFPFKRIF